MMGGGVITGLKTFENKLHGSADKNTFWIYSLFETSKRRKKLNSFQYKLEGGLISGGGLIAECLFFWLQVDGPIFFGGRGF